jgi:hypothetical protein
MPSKKKPKKSQTKKSKTVILKKADGKSGKAKKSQPAAKTTSASKPAPGKMLLQGTGKGLTGTAASPPPNSSFYQVQPNYQGADGVVSTVPFLLPPTLFSTGSSQWGKSIEVDVSNVYGQNTSSGGTSCAIAGLDFTLSWTSDGAGGFIAQAFIPAYAWNVAASDRAKLSAAFATFCQALETLEGNQCLMRGGAQAIAQRVVEALPLALSEVLYYKYGFNAASGYVDLQPGLRLRIEFETFEFTVPNSPLNGFVGGGVGYYDVCGYLDQSGNQRLAFDAFLGAIRQPNLTSPTMVAGGIIDLQGSKTARRYYRLFYPATISSSSQGNTSTANNVMLIGANTLADLASATSSYLSSQTCAPGGSSILCNLFRGRAIAVPEILVYLGGQTFIGQVATTPPTSALPIYVPIGTTVRNLVERRFNWTFTPTQRAETKIQLIRQYRQINSSAPKPAPANYNTVQFNMYAPPPSLPGPDVYDLPLVKGDVLGFTLMV